MSQPAIKNPQTNNQRNFRLELNATDERSNPHYLQLKYVASHRRQSANSCHSSLPKANLKICVDLRAVTQRHKQRRLKTGRLHCFVNLL